MSNIRFLQNCYNKGCDDKEIDEIKLKMQEAYKSLGAYDKNGTLRRLSDDDMYCLSDKRLSYNATYNIISKCSGYGFFIST